MSFSKAREILFYGEEFEPDVDEKLEKLTDKCEAKDWPVTINPGVQGTNIYFSIEHDIEYTRLEWMITYLSAAASILAHSSKGKCSRFNTWIRVKAMNGVDVDALRFRGYKSYYDKLDFQKIPNVWFRTRDIAYPWGKISKDLSCAFLKYPGELTVFIQVIDKDL